MGQYPLTTLAQVSVGVPPPNVRDHTHCPCQPQCPYLILPETMAEPLEKAASEGKAATETTAEEPAAGEGGGSAEEKSEKTKWARFAIFLSSLEQEAEILAACGCRREGGAGGLARWHIYCV